LFVFIFIQSYVNSNLHVSTLFILIIHKESNSESLKIVHLLASGTFNAPYVHYVIKIGYASIPKRRTFSPMFLFCTYDSSVFTHLLLDFSHGTILMA
jgi:hypothetical protein